MQQSKYFFDNIPLADYCREHGLNVTSAYTAIHKKKKNPKYADYTDQQIVDMVVKAMGTAVKYYYGDMTLRQYCLTHDLVFQTIYTRVEKLKKKKPNLDDNEAVRQVVEEFENHNYKFYFEGVPLVDYCKAHPDVVYKTVVYRINKALKIDPKVDAESVIRAYLQEEHRGPYKYYYCGIPLRQYCKDNNYSYKYIGKRIRDFKKSEEYKGQSDDEVVEIVINRHQPFEIKYMYKEVSLYTYCQEHNLSYYSVVSYIKRSLEKNPNLKIDEVIAKGIDSISHGRYIYYYQGIPLVDYCKDNNINYKSVLSSILRKKNTSNYPLQEIVNRVVENYKAMEIKYFIGEETLRDYCKRMNINYGTITKTYTRKYASREDILMENALKEIVADYLNNPYKPVKYYFEGDTLRSFCEEKGYSYSLIHQRIRNLKKNNPSMTDDDLAKEAIAKHEKRLEIDKIKSVFVMLKNENLLTDEDIRGICDLLKIDYMRVIDIVEMGFSFSQAVSMIWYYYDIIDEEKKIISDERIAEVLALAEKAMHFDKGDIFEFELFDLVKIYKCNLFDARNLILLRSKKYIYSVMNKICLEYDINYNASDIEEFLCELRLFIINVIENTCLNNEGQMIKYMDLTVRGSFRSYLKRYIKSNNTISLDRTIYDKDKPSKLTFLDRLATVDEEEKDNSFGEELSQALAGLGEEERKFINLKYQSGYDDDELTQYYHIDLETLKNWEIKILEYLRDSSPLKKMKVNKG